MSIFGAKTLQPCDANRILVADDEPPIRKLFLMILASEFPEMQIDQARNGIEAVRLFGERYHRVILMDLRMPEMDGLQAFHAIQNICQRQSIAIPSVVFCTGFVPPDGVTDIVEDGSPHGLLRKPVRSQDIILAVRSRLDTIPPSPTVTP
jgi:CheY-like chemotaxis protein